MRGGIHRYWSTNRSGCRIFKVEILERYGTPSQWLYQLFTVLQNQHERVPAETAGNQLVDLSALPPTDTVSHGAPNDNAAPASPGDSCDFSSYRVYAIDY
jgi:hypothetical protein